MASKVSSILRLLGHYNYEAGAHMYHARDGARDGGEVDGRKTHKFRKALHKMRLRASGMTDDIYGSKEVGGTLEDPHEHEV